ncbi:uncharacterized protein LOC132724389 [Ruditapes philippinarum]|uniref:uncharacterized protein LOC132724389 n=1 Tax=Ruditapes philippinarum TaxID=129788 RepID=UPI00295C2D6C|nr:uncharacterized protein LOC132724389 [Ruditapes philippinarum]
MEQIETISKVVDEAYKKSEDEERQANPFWYVPSGSFPLDHDEENYKTAANATKEPTKIDLVELATQETQWSDRFNDTYIYKKSKLSKPGRTSFSEVVEEVIQEHLRNDVHPFGRTSFYRRSIGASEQTSIHQDDGTLFMWALATIIILAVAVGVIAMSQMHQATRHVNVTTTSMLN